LAARSKEFKKLFADMEQNNANTPKKEIKITDSDFTYESFMALIEFLYTDFADGLTPEVAEKLLPVATRYVLYSPAKNYQFYFSDRFVDTDCLVLKLFARSLWRTILTRNKSSGFLALLSKLISAAC
jgi:hypothetical protein